MAGLLAEAKDGFALIVHIYCNFRKHLLAYLHLGHDLSMHTPRPTLGEHWVQAVHFA